MNLAPVVCVQDMTPQQVAWLAWAHGKLSVSNKWLFEDLLERSLDIGLLVFPARQLAMLVWGLGRSRYPLPDEWVQPYLAATYDKLPYFETSSLCSVAWGLNACGVRANREWQLAFEAISRDQFSNMGPLDLAQLSRSLSIFEFQADWWAGFYEAALKQLKSMRPRELAAVLEAAASAAVQPPARWLARVHSAVASGFEEYDDRIASRILASLSHLRPGVDAAAAARYAAAVIRRLGARNVAPCVRALTAVSVWPLQLEVQDMVLLKEKLWTLRQRLTLRELCSLLVGLHRLGCELDAWMIRLLHKSVGTAIQSSKSANFDILQVLHAMQLSGGPPSAALWHSMEVFVLQQPAERISGDLYMDVLDYVHRIGIQPSYQWLMNVYSRLAASYPGLSEPQQERLAKVVQQLGVPPQGALKRFLGASLV